MTQAPGRFELLNSGLLPRAIELWTAPSLEPNCLRSHDNRPATSLRPGVTMPPLSRIRGLAKAAAPRVIVRAIRWRRDVWADARLRLLCAIGHVPSHTLRNTIYRFAGIVLPASSSIHWRAEFFAPEGIVIGENTTIGDSTFLDGRSGLHIGSNVNLGSHVRIWTRQHDIDAPDFAEVGARVNIGDYAYLGSGCIVLPGVTIGEGGVAAAGSVVTKDVPPYTLVAGVPARVIRERSRDLNYRLGYAKRFV
jgi:acetyltransferase-like isoleucine patch superfamily enzyme